ncbi:hypothetical protein ACP70R_028868 [Stipagrostis hirtigluma subsp. patula]
MGRFSLRPNRRPPNRGALLPLPGLRRTRPAATMGGEGKSRKRRPSPSSGEDEGRERKRRDKKENRRSGRDDREEDERRRKSKKSKHSDRDKGKERDSKERHSKEKGKSKQKDKDAVTGFKEISKDDYFSKNNEFAAWLKEEKGKYFSDLSSKSARELFLKFVKRWNKGKLPSQYYEGISSGPRSAHNWNIKA